MARKTTLNTSAVLRELGIVGGEQLSEIADGPATPVVVISDQSRSFTTETVEPRAIASATITATGNDPISGSPTVPAFVLTSLGAGGIVVDDLRMEALALGGGTPQDASVQHGAFWPSVFRSGGAGQRYPLSTIAGGPSAVPLQNFGQTVVRSRLLIGERGGPAVTGVAVPASFQVQPGARWFVPAGFDFVIQMNARSDGAGNDPLAAVYCSFREITGAHGTPNQ